MLHFVMFSVPGVFQFQLYIASLLLNVILQLAIHGTVIWWIKLEKNDEYQYLTGHKKEIVMWVVLLYIM
jgi:hypothetical protein